MKRLLEIELQKLWKNRASKVLILAYFILLSFIALIAAIKFEFGNFRLHIAEQGIFNFPFIWHFNTWIASIFKLFLAIVIVSMMANEYSYGTLKQNLIDGLSKKEFIQSKFLTVLLFAFGSTVFVFIMSLILGYSYSSYNEFSIVFSDLEYLFAYFIKLTAFFSFCLLLGILVKRSAFALGFLLLWSILESIAIGLMRWKFFKDTDVYQQVSQFFPLESMSNLIKEPFTRLSVIKNLSSTISGQDMAKDYSVHFGDVTIVLIWTVIFMLISYKILKKRDL